MKIDTIASDFGFTYKGDKKYRTLIGGLISLLIYVFLLATLIYIGLEFFNKDKPSIISGVSFVADPANTSLAPSNFAFFLAVEDPTNNLRFFKDETIYQMKARLYKRITSLDEKGNQVVVVERPNLKLEDCDLKKHFPGMEESFNQTEYKNAYCLDPSQNLFMKGEFTNNEFYEIQFYVYPCNNSTMNNTCKSQKEIEKKLDSSYITFNYGYYFYYPKDFYNPLLREITNYFTIISTTSQKKVYSYVKRINYTTDYGSFFQDFSTQSFAQIDYIKEVTSPSTLKQGDYIWSMDLRLSYIEEVNTRSYMKLQTILATLGGLYNGLFQISFYINSYLLSHLFWIDIINQNFRVVKTSENEIHNDSVNKSNIRLAKLHSSNLNLRNVNLNMSDHIAIDKNIIGYVEENINKSKEEKDKLHLKGWNYISQILLYCCSSYSKLQKRRKYLKGKEYIKSQLDIKYILNKFREIDILKYHLLSDNELVLFKSLPLPNLKSLMDNKTKDLDIFFKIEKDVEKSETVTACKKLFTEDSKNKLFRLMFTNERFFMENDIKLYNK